MKWQDVQRDVLPALTAGVLQGARALVRGSSLLGGLLFAVLATLEALGVPAVKLFASLCSSNLPLLPPVQ